MIEFNGTIVVQIINFGIFLLIMRALIFKPIISQIEERRNYINASQKKIQEYIAKLEESEKQGKLMLDEARKKSQEIVEEAIKIAEESKNSIINQALDETKKSFEEFKINLQKEVLSTKSALLYEVNNIAEDIANKVTKLSVNQKISA
jgi:F-type H+-transporting ATPase subunit b